MTGRNDVRAEIRQFLTTRRAKLTPERAGLPRYGRNRRVPGLRRVEVALLAGISIEDYTRLERGNARGVSDEVLEALARALQLDEVERAHLIDLVRTANAVRPARRQATPQRVRFIFLDRRSTEFSGDWDGIAHAAVGSLRAEAGRDPFDRALTDLVGELSVRSQEFRVRWAAHDVDYYRLRHLSKEAPVPIQPTQPTTKGPAEWFTGDVFLDPVVRGEEPSRVRVSAVRFTPSARTAWHAHAVGQTLYVTDGRGLVQSRGGPVEEIRAGDVVSTPPDEWHWHGAAPDHFMTHLSITEAVAGDQRPETDWGEHVTDDEYSPSP